MSPNATVTVATGDLEDLRSNDDFATFVEVQGGSVVAVEQFYTS